MFLSCVTDFWAQLYAAEKETKINISRSFSLASNTVMDMSHISVWSIPEWSKHVTGVHSFAWLEIWAVLTCYGSSGKEYQQHEPTLQKQAH